MPLIADVASVNWRQPADLVIAGLPTQSLARIDDLTFAVIRAAAGGIHSAYPPGTLIRCDDQVWVQAARGHVVLETLRTPDGRELPAADVFAGLDIPVGTPFTTPLMPTAATLAA